MAERNEMASCCSFHLVYPHADHVCGRFGEAGGPCAVCGQSSCPTPNACTFAASGRAPSPFVVSAAQQAAVSEDPWTRAGREAAMCDVAVVRARWQATCILLQATGAPPQRFLVDVCAERLCWCDDGQAHAWRPRVPDRIEPLAARLACDPKNWAVERAELQALAWVAEQLGHNSDGLRATALRLLAQGYRDCWQAALGEALAEARQRASLTRTFMVPHGPEPCGARSIKGG